MSGSLNRVCLIGNLGRDPEVRFAQNGNKIVNMSIATSESWKDKQTGERVEKTEWHRIVIFDTMIADIAEKYLHKGSKVYIEGALQTRKWTDNSGAEKYTTEIVIPKFRGVLTMLDTRGSGGDSQQSSEPPGEPAAEEKPGSVSADPDLDNEIPF